MRAQANPVEIMPGIHGPEIAALVPTERGPRCLRTAPLQRPACRIRHGFQRDISPMCRNMAKGQPAFLIIPINILICRILPPQPSLSILPCAGILQELEAMTAFLDFNVEESPICFPQKRRDQFAVQEQIALRSKLANETVLIGCRNLKGSAESTKPCGPGGQRFGDIQPVRAFRSERHTATNDHPCRQVRPRP